ncbi:MAG: response regulator [Alphaproteobacteria bacterium]|nr:response regulator [Alphaproteobacteria bacterium]
MKILIVDHDEMAVQLIKSKLEPLGHQVVVEKAKNNAVDRVAGENFDIIFLDPAPLTSARPIVLNIRRSVRNFPYVILLSANGSREEAVKAGMNDYVAKPVDPDALAEKIENAQSLIELVDRIGDDSEDFPSAGGVIAKSAFNQLFLSAIDRADRYGEKTYLLFISLSNYQEILETDGPYAADYAVAKLSQYLVLLRRQSDIIGQTAKYEYTLMLQRPQYETEPHEAASRFADALSGYKDLASSGVTVAEVTVRLLDIPTGRTVAEYIFTPGATQSQSAE